MQKDTLAECTQWGEFPVTTVGIYTPDYETRWDVSLETAVGCGVTSRELIRTFTSRRDAEAFVAREYGITRQAVDGATAWEGWWLS